MSQQLFLYVMGADGREAALQRRLEGAGFMVTPSGRMTGGIHVRIRKDTGDEAEVEQIMREVAPGARFGPPGAPSMSIQDYREGR